jgi:hypothetical protein
MEANPQKYLCWKSLFPAEKSCGLGETSTANSLFTLTKPAKVAYTLIKRHLLHESSRFILAVPFDLRVSLRNQKKINK